MFCTVIRCKHKKKLTNTKKIQDFNSSFCGFFAMSVSLWIEKYKSNNLNKFLQQFSNNTKENDYICIQLIKQIINK